MPGSVKGLEEQNGDCLCGSTKLIPVPIDLEYSWEWGYCIILSVQHSSCCSFVFTYLMCELAGHKWSKRPHSCKPILPLLPYCLKAICWFVPLFVCLLCPCSDLALPYINPTLFSVLSLRVQLLLQGCIDYTHIPGVSHFHTWYLLTTAAENCYFHNQIVAQGRNS